MHLSIRPIKSSGIALNELWHRVLINMSCRHKMNLLKSTGFSFLISSVGLGAQDGGALPLLIQSKMYSVPGLPRRGGTLCTARDKHIRTHTEQILAYCKCSPEMHAHTQVL